MQSLITMPTAIDKSLMKSGRGHFVRGNRVFPSEVQQLSKCTMLGGSFASANYSHISGIQKTAPPSCLHLLRALAWPWTSFRFNLEKLVRERTHKVRHPCFNTACAQSRRTRPPSQILSQSIQAEQADSLSMDLARA